MDSSATTFHDASPEELIRDLLQHLDKLEQRAEVTALDRVDDAILQIVQRSPILFATTVEPVPADKDIEAVFNLIIFLLDQIEQPATLAKCLDGLVQTLSSSKERYPLKLRLFSHLFNKLATASGVDKKHQLRVLRATIQLAATADDIDAIQPQLGHLDAWMKEWHIDVAAQRDLYQLLQQIMTEQNETKQAQFFLMKWLTTFNGAQQTKETAEAAKKAILAAMQSEDVFIFDELVSLDAVKALATQNAPEHALLKLFLDGNLKQTKLFLQQNKSFLQSSGSLFRSPSISRIESETERAGLNEEQCVRKMRLLTLTSLAAENVSGSVPYSSIATELEVAEDDVEEWIIDVIQAGLVEAKMDQLKQMVHISRATHRTFAPQQWQIIASKLDAWKSSLDDILKMVDNVRTIAEAEGITDMEVEK